MSDFYIRKTTGCLMLLLFVLSLVCAGLIATLIARGESSPIVEDEVEIVKSPSFESSREAGKLGNFDKKEAKTSDNADNISSKQSQPWEENIRIPTTSLPLHYDLLLHPDLDETSFTGHVSITIAVTSIMDYLVCHVKQMNITTTQLNNKAGDVIPIAEAFEYEPNQFWVVRPRQSLMPDNYTLSIEFDGQLKGHIVGFYMSEYTTQNGEKRRIATSKFQPTDARRAFPCFDEPSFKSTFSTTLVRPSKDYVALSNMPVETEVADLPSPGLTTVKFKKSVPMVTYLACFIVCDFEYLEVATEANKPFRVYATRDQIGRAAYARDIGVHILNYFEKYFEVPYPLPKQDMIAIPDFVSGAMEHWGLITYRETNMLYDTTNSSSYNKQRVASVVSHELAHMWFGNLVTLKWWDDLWLNEGFASYIEYKGVQSYEKDWDMDQQFVTIDLQSVMELDQILASHPIVQEVNHPDEITEIFDKISYSKGASVLRMLEDFLGAEAFRIGVRNFLRRYEFSHAVTADLWKELQKEAPTGVNVEGVMDTWTRQKGFPVVTIAQNSDKTMLELRQEYFLVDGSDIQNKNSSPFGYKWDIPVTFMTNNMGRKLLWFPREQDSVSIDISPGTEWIKLNVNQFGFYRVNYNHNLWKKLVKVLQTNHKLLSPSDRANLLDDSFSLAASGRLSYDIALEVAAYLPKETHLVPWMAAKKHLNNLASLLYATDAYKYFKQYVLKLAGPQVERVGWEDVGTHTERLNRGLILNLACSIGHRRCLEGAANKFKDSLARPIQAALPSNLRSASYTYGIKATDGKEWEKLFELYTKELNAQEKDRMVVGLVATNEPWIAIRLLELSRNDSIVRRQDFFSLLSKMAKNPNTLHVVWDFVRSNWEWMVDSFSLNNRYLGDMVRIVAYQFNSELKLQELQAFFAAYPDAGAGGRSRTQALEKVNQNIRWLKRNLEPLSQALIKA